MGSPSLLHPLGERRKCMSKKSNSALKINKIQPTDEKIIGRCGMSLLVRYADKTGILDKLTEIFRDLSKSKKGVGVYNLCKQVVCYFVEGESLTLTRFDELKKDEAYAGIIEMGIEEMVSSQRPVKIFVSEVIVKIHEAIYKKLRIAYLWMKSNRASPIYTS
jgi:hypothetical protein